MRASSRKWTPSARTSTLILALLGVLGHARLYSSLGDLESTFPRVPQSPLNLPGASTPAPPVLPKPLWGWNGRHPSTNLLNSTVTQATLLASSTASTPTSTVVQGTSSSPASTASVAAPAAWYNLLPHNAARLHSVPGEQKQHSLNDAGQQQLDEERESWEAARLVTKTLRIYALCSILASIVGAIGVVRSSLLATRIFVMSSFLDVFLYTLSLLSLLLLLTYPGIRSQVCELFASGSLQTSLGDGRLAASSDQSAWWERIIEELFAGEECDEAFARDVVPMLLVFSLLYTGLRFYCFFIVRHYYMQLWVVHQYLPSGIASSSSSSSSTSTPPPPCRSRSSSQSSSSLDDMPHCWSLFGTPIASQAPTRANRTKAKLAQGWQEKIA